MPSWLTAAVVGVAGGLVASFVMDRYQGATAKAFGQDGGNGDPATVKAADTASLAVEGRPVTQKHRAAAGSLVHYGTGAAMGLGYAFLAEAVPLATIGFGTAFGFATMLVFDDLLVPAAGWGPWPGMEPGVHLYSLTSHLVFGVALEGVRRGGIALLS
jgi:hypothetical protein